MPSTTIQHRLSAGGVCAAIISVHYGAGFILGTGEEAYCRGLAGALYPLATVVATLALIPFVGFYLSSREHVATRLAVFFQAPKLDVTIRASSSLMMLGIAGAQVRGALLLLTAFIPESDSPSVRLFAIALMSLALSALSEAGLRLAPKIGLACVITASLALASRAVSSPAFEDGAAGFATALATQMGTVPHERIGGIFIPTILVTVSAMDFGQILQTADSRAAGVRGCVAAALLLVPLSFLPAIALLRHDVPAAPTICPPRSEIAVQIAMLPGSAVGSGLLATSLVIASLVCGSAVAKASALDRLVKDSGAKPTHRFILTATAVALVSLLAEGTPLVELLARFYAVYVAIIFVPFVAMVLEVRNLRRFDGRTIYEAASVASLTSILALVGLPLARWRALPVPSEDSDPLHILVLGVGAGILAAACSSYLRPLVARPHDV